MRVFLAYLQGGCAYRLYSPDARLSLTRRGTLAASPATSEAGVEVLARNLGKIAGLGMPEAIRSVRCLG
jgi:hypothetical protein